MRGRTCLALTVVLSLYFSMAFATAPDKKEIASLHNDYVKVLEVKETEQTEEKFINDGSKAALKHVPFKNISIVAELLKKPPMKLDTVFSSNKKIPELRVCIYERNELGKLVREGTCETFLFETLSSGSIGTASFHFPPDFNDYGIKLADKQPNKGSTFELWTPNESDAK